MVKRRMLQLMRNSCTFIFHIALSKTLPFISEHKQLLPSLVPQPALAFGVLTARPGFSAAAGWAGGTADTSYAFHSVPCCGGLGSLQAWLGTPRSRQHPLALPGRSRSLTRGETWAHPALCVQAEVGLPLRGRYWPRAAGLCLGLVSVNVPGFHGSLTDYLIFFWNCSISPKISLRKLRA